MLREPADADWPRILELANRSVAHVKDAGPQQEWLANRRKQMRGRQHFVFERKSDVLGYGAIEPNDDVRNGYRVFIVTAPECRADVGETLFAHASAYLDANVAAQSWFIEYAQDAAFLEFIEQHGYAETRRFDLPDGPRVVVLTKSHTRSHS